MQLRYPRCRGAECQPIYPMHRGSQNLALSDLDNHADGCCMQYQTVSFSGSFLGLEGNNGCKEAIEQGTVIAYKGIPPIKAARISVHNEGKKEWRRFLVLGVLRARLDDAG